MARTSIGLASEVVRYPLRQTPLSAIQELIGAIGATGTSFRRFDLGEYDVFLFAVRREPDQLGEPRTGARRPTRKPAVESAGSLPNMPTPSLEAIAHAACKRLKVTKREFQSDSRRRPVALARFLTAHHASKAGVATIEEVATQMKNRKANSLYVGIARYRKIFPDLFRMSIEQFLRMTEGSSKKLQTLTTRRASKSNADIPTTDSEIGERLAKALPQEITQP
jgi:hypothetical protein